MIHHDIIWGDRDAELRTLNAIKEKNQEYELILAKRIIRKMNDSPEIKGVLQALVANAMEDMGRLVFLAGDYGDRAFEAALRKDAINYKWVREKYNVPSPRDATAAQRRDLLAPRAGDFKRFLSSNCAANVFGLRVDQCVDLIRFYGEVLEALEKEVPMAYQPHKLYQNLVKRSKDYQLGNKKQWDKGKTGERGRVMGKIGQIHGRTVDIDFLANVGPQKPDETGDEYAERKRVHKLAKAFLKRRTETEKKLARARHGISLWVQTPADRVAKIDKAFGLSHGATISGTTTDHVFFYNRMSLVDRYLGEDVTHRVRDESDEFLEKFYGGPRGPYQKSHVVARNQIIDPIFYIIPLGGIVGNEHHTMIECAAPLCLNGIIDYTVGLYSSLIPVDRGRRKAVDASAVEALLRRHRIPRRVLIYYGTDKQPRGFIEFCNMRDDPENRGRDSEIWRNIAHVTQQMLDRFASFAEFPNRDNIASLHPDIAKLLEAEHREGLGTKEQKASFQSAQSFWEQRTN